MAWREEATSRHKWRRMGWQPNGVMTRRTRCAGVGVEGHNGGGLVSGATNSEVLRCGRAARLESGGKDAE
jgi:hypothetical protein